MRSARVPRWRWLTLRPADRTYQTDLASIAAFAPRISYRAPFVDRDKVKNLSKCSGLGQQVVTDRAPDALGGGRHG